MGLKDANEVFEKVVDKTELMDDKLTGTMKNLSNDLLSKTKRARTFLNKAEKSHGDQRISHLEKATDAIGEAGDDMDSLGDEATELTELTKEIGDLYEQLQDVILE